MRESRAFWGELVEMKDATEAMKLAEKPFGFVVTAIKLTVIVSPALGNGTPRLFISSPKR